MREPCAISTAAETASQSSQQSDQCVHIFSQASCLQDVRAFASRHFPQHICPRPSFLICTLVFLMTIDWMRSVALDYALLLVIKNFTESPCTLYKHVSRVRRNQLPEQEMSGEACPTFGIVVERNKTSYSCAYLCRYSMYKFAIGMPTMALFIVNSARSLRLNRNCTEKQSAETHIV